MIWTKEIYDTIVVVVLLQVYYFVYFINVKEISVRLESL